MILGSTLRATFRLEELTMRLRERLGYLNEMGVSQWFARRKLLGAATSCLPGDEQGFSEEKSLAEPKSEGRLKSAVAGQHVPKDSRVFERDNVLESNKPSTEPSSAQIADIKDLTAKSLAVSETTDSSVESASPSVVMEVPVPLNFNVRAYRVAHVLVTTEGGAGDAVSAENEKALLGNILRASGVVVEGVDSLGAFSWPIFNNANLCRLDGVTEQLLLPRFLENCQDDAIYLHLHFGSTLSSIVEDFSLGKPSENEARNAFLCFENSLSQMMAMPMLKAKLWRSLSSHLSLFSR